MNRRDLREQIYVRTGFDSQDEYITAPVVNAAINDALHFIEVSRDWPWLEATETLTTTAGVNYVEPDSSTWMRTRSLTHETGDALEQTAISDFDLLDSTATDSYPSRYAVFGGKIYLWPTPAGAVDLTHRFIQTEPDLTSDSSTPQIPASFHPAIIELASAFVLARTRDDDRAAVAKARFSEWERVMADNRRRYTRPSVVRVRDELS